MKLTMKRMMTGSSERNEDKMIGNMSVTPFTAKVVKTGARATMRKKAAGTN